MNWSTVPTMSIVALVSSAGSVVTLLWQTSSSTVLAHVLRDVLVDGLGDPGDRVAATEDAAEQPADLAAHDRDAVDHRDAVDDLRHDSVDDRHQDADVGQDLGRDLDDVLDRLADLLHQRCLGDIQIDLGVDGDGRVMQCGLHPVHHLVGDRRDLAGHGGQDVVDDTRAQQLGVHRQVVEVAPDSRSQVDRHDAGLQVEADAGLPVLRGEQVLHERLQVADVDGGRDVGVRAEQVERRVDGLQQTVEVGDDRAVLAVEHAEAARDRVEGRVDLLGQLRDRGTPQLEHGAGEVVVARRVLAVRLRLCRDRLDREVEVDEVGGELAAQDAAQADRGVRARKRDVLADAHGSVIDDRAGRRVGTGVRGGAGELPQHAGLNARGVDLHAVAVADLDRLKHLHLERVLDGHGRVVAVVPGFGRFDRCDGVEVRSEDRTGEELRLRPADVVVAGWVPRWRIRRRRARTRRRK